MAIKFRIFIRKLLIVVNLVLAFIFILACLAPYLNPVKWWFISWLGLIFPILLFLTLVSFFFWLFIRPGYSWLFLIALLIGWNSIRVFFVFYVYHEFAYEYPVAVVRVFSGYVVLFREMKRNNYGGSGTR